MEKKLLLYFILLISYSAISQKKNTDIELDSLQKAGHKIQVLKFNYGNIACPCAQWAESKYNGKNSFHKRVQTYLEPINDSIAKILTIDSFPFKVKVTGEYVNEWGFPKDFKKTKGDPGPAPVFRVYKIKVLSKN